MSDILWPSGYLPGTTDNYVSNDIIVAGLGAAEVWPRLDNTLAWPTCYGNVSDISFDDGSGPRLSQGARFRFTTFGFAGHAKVTEYQPPAPGVPARVAWDGWVEGDAATRLDAHHAWLLEDLPGGRVRIRSQERAAFHAAPGRRVARPAGAAPPPPSRWRARTSSGSSTLSRRRVSMPLMAGCVSFRRAAARVTLRSSSRASSALRRFGSSWRRLGMAPILP